MNRILGVLIFCVCFLLQLNSQANLKIGYESVYLSSEQNRIAVDGFNEAFSETLEQGKELRPLGFMNGLTIGVSYKWDFMRLSANWHSSSRRREAYGEDPVTEIAFEREIRYRITGLNLQYELLYDRYSAGISAGRDVFGMTSLIGSTDNDRTILDEVAYNIRFNLGFRLITTEKVSMYLEPYYTLLLDDINHENEFIFLEVPSEPSGLFDRPHYFGIQLTFHNGLQ